MANLETNVEFGRCSFKETDVDFASENDDDFISETDKEPVNVQDIRIGNLYFGRHYSDTKHIPFILAPYATDLENMIAKIFEEWNLSLPRIVIIAVAQTENSASDEYRKHSRKLVKCLLHALNTTEMWLCTDGLNYGFSRDIGKAFENELFRRKIIEGNNVKKGSSVFPKTALFGICRREILKFSSKLGPKKAADEEETEAETSINECYDYFIFVEDSSETKKGRRHFLLNFASYMSEGKINAASDESEEPKTNKSKTPVMVLLLQGKIAQIDFILGHIKLGLPVVVFEGSGGLADLIVYTYHQLIYRPEGINEAEYTEAVLKPQLLNMMNELYPNISDYKISLFTEKIFDCIRYSKQHDQELITIIDLTDADISPSSLTEHLLKALLKAEPSDIAKDVKQMKNDLVLTMDWNCPIIAKEKVFDRHTTGMVQIDTEMFYRALTRPQREEFESLFVNQGFSMHSFLNTPNFLKLFQNSLSRKFFKDVVWERVLGSRESSEISTSFLNNTLIILLEDLTGIPTLIDPDKLHWNSGGNYEDRTPEEAERMAVIALSMWAILSYRIQLVKTIWRHSEQPIHLALACSAILKKLENYVTDLSIKNELVKYSKEFSEMAANVMSLGYESVPCRAIDLLKEKNINWSYKAIMELAAFSKNKQFLAHPSCQKHLDNIFMGFIKVKDLSYGDVTIPLWLKIVLSTFLIFPIFLWIRFEVPYEAVQSDKQLERSDPNNLSEEQDQLTSNVNKKQQQPSLLRKIYYFYSAPITKFWLYQVFYLLFLILFSSAVIWPSCGNAVLDFFTCVWLAIMIIDLIYDGYTLNLKYTSMSSGYKKSLEISLMTLFLFGYIMGRIILPYSFITPYNAKVMLCIALLYFYYRFIFIALPISSELGPMLYRVRRMTSVDFVNYMRVTILVIVSNGIVIHAVVFPDYPLNWELVRKAFYDAIIAFFLMPAEAYVGTPNPKCILLKRHPNKMSFIGLSPETCRVGRYFKNDCPNPGVWPYLFGLQYMIILRLILVVMLYAIFSNTTRKLEEEGKYIWKYQRYPLVINFANRLTLPPPLSIFTLIYIVVKNVYFCSCSFAEKYSKLKIFSNWKRKDNLITHEKLNENDFRFWKSLAMQYYKQKKQEKAEEITTQKRMKITDVITADYNTQKVAIANLVGHLNELQLQIADSHQYLKGIGLQMTISERLDAKNVPQIFSRISPYPNTSVSRYPVSDNHVPWKIYWTRYDPISFTLPTNDYSPDQRSYVDVDIERKRELEGEAFQMPNFNWNTVSISPGGVIHDRKTWITDKSGHCFSYELDSEGLPRNPFGRTGLKGRGSLLRWGPNHYIYVVITQLHEKEELLFHNYLNVLLIQKDHKDRFGLPGGYVHTDNRYEIINSLFDTEQSWKNSEDMISFFESLKQSEISGKRKFIWERKKKESKDETEFTIEKVKLGYMDEETNTDQAWCEAEIWHINYNIQTNVKEKLKVEAEWHFLTYESLQKVPAGQASIMHTIAKKMKAVLEVI